MKKLIFCVACAVLCLPMVGCGGSNSVKVPDEPAPKPPASAFQEFGGPSNGAGASAATPAKQQGNP